MAQTKFCLNILLAENFLALALKTFASPSETKMIVNSLHILNWAHSNAGDEEFQNERSQLLQDSLSLFEKLSCPCVISWCL